MLEQKWVLKMNIYKKYEFTSYMYSLNYSYMYFFVLAINGAQAQQPRKNQLKTPHSKTRAMDRGNGYFWLARRSQNT